MVLAVLFEQYIPSHRGLARNRESLAAANDRLLWQQHHYRNSTYSKYSQRHLQDDNSHVGGYNRNSLLDVSASNDNSNKITNNITNNNIRASTRPKRNRCKASKLLASLAADFDVLTDWLFYFHCHKENVEYFENEGNQENYRLPRWMVGIVLASCLVGTTLWLVLATDGAIATPILRFFGYDKLSLGHILLACVVFEDLPQVVLTFFIEDYFEEDQEFNNYAVMNVVASLYDTLIKLAEAYDQRADIVETGHWCKDNIHAHNGKIVCLVPIPDDTSSDDSDQMIENMEANGAMAYAGSSRSSILSHSNLSNNGDSIRENSLRDSISISAFSENDKAFSSFRGSANANSNSNSSLFQNKLHVSTRHMQRKRRRTLLQEAREMVADTKLPSMRFLSASKDGTVKLWDTSINTTDESGHRKPCELFVGHDKRVSCISFVRKVEKGELQLQATDATSNHATSKSSYYFLTGSYDGTTKLWTTSDSKCLKTYTTPPYKDESATKIEVTSIAYMNCQDEDYIVAPYVSPSLPTTSTQSRSEYFVNGYKSGKVRLWDMWSQTCLRIFEEQTNPSKRFFRLYKKRKSRIYSMCSMEDSRHFVAGSLDGKIKMWDAGINSNSNTSYVNEAIDTIAEADDESSSEDHTTATTTTISMTSTPEQVFMGHTATVFAVKCVSPGSVLLSGSEDTTAKLWSVSTGSCLQTFFGHTGPVHDVAIVDQVTFLTASMDKTIMAWDAMSGDAFRTYENNTNSQYPVTAVATGGQSGCFLSGDEKGTIGLWIFSAVHDQHDRANLLDIDDEVMVCGDCQGKEDILNEEIHNAQEYTRIS
eukprot:CAMPEP_0116140094 /NCGR_PEP_ID=MMETSP0329-20121206/13656_1 /TAXON_ID=697910 /ORGANISM="Pseudo-nitzschia arenysensis, Strain B593" /LENGTH=820 /DNA_ID=CAMNT_0003635169 /DNA_START=135 /DNA_END=2597 /DNA_ORIENTATION=-